MVVDDEPTVREALERVLRLEGYEVAAVANSADAFAQLHRQPIDLVLLDINLGDENGLAICQRIHETQPDLAVVGITARPDQTNSAATAGVRALMEKPLDMPVLLGTLRNLLA
ncbi:MAG: TorCAD operon transcriptional regulatory protein TorR [Verrucomicrobiae bacterium]|nr:TorCAD operon transcriptional regulatory protein TorR [Verrucomicrobiae bacterium]